MMCFWVNLWTAELCITGRDQVDLNIQLDFAKAFDKVPHRRLLHKLHYYGIRNETHKWIESFLLLLGGR
jgi:hypothetical protein